MSRIPTPITRLLASATVLGAIAFAVPAFAASATEDAPVVATKDAARAVQADRADRVEKRITSLRNALHITAEQEPQWSIVAQAMRDNAKTMDSLIKERSANAKTMTAVDDLRSYEKLAAAHEDGLKTFVPQFEILYNSMSDGQKKAADVAFRGHGRRPHMNKKN